MIDCDTKKEDFVFSYRVSVKHMCGKTAESEQRESTADCDWRLLLSAESTQTPTQRQEKDFMTNNLIN